MPEIVQLKITIDGFVRQSPARSERNKSMKIRVYHEDTDAGGVVYYANYLRYFERSRTDLIEGLGFSIRDFQNQGIWFTVVRVEVSYRSPAIYGDTLEVTTQVEQVKKVRFSLSHEIRRPLTGELIVDGFTVMACVNPEMKPRILPPELAAALTSHRGPGGV